MRFSISLLFILLSVSIGFSQGQFVQVEYISKYYYQIRNTAPGRLRLQFDNTSTLNDDNTFWLSSGGRRTFSRYYNFSSILTVDYPDWYYNNQRKKIQKELNPYLV